MPNPPGIEYEIAGLDHELSTVQRRTLKRIVDHYEAAIAAAYAAGKERAAFLTGAVIASEFHGDWPPSKVNALLKSRAAAIRADREAMK